MSTVVITKTKVPVEAIPLSSLTVAFDPEIPAGTVARAEVSVEKGWIHPKIFMLSAESEVEGVVYVYVDGVERDVLSVGEGESREIDVDECYGELMTRSIVLEGRTKTRTTSLRSINLYYCGGIFEYR